MPKIKKEVFDCNHPPILPIKGEHPDWQRLREKIYGNQLEAMQAAELDKLRARLNAEAEAKLAAAKGAIEQRIGQVVGDYTPREEVAPVSRPKALLGDIIIEDGVTSGEVAIAPAGTAAEVAAGMSGASEALAAVAQAGVTKRGSGRATRSSVSV